MLLETIEIGSYVLIQKIFYGQNKMDASPAYQIGAINQVYCGISCTPAWLDMSRTGKTVIQVRSEYILETQNLSTAEKCVYMLNSSDDKTKLLNKKNKILLIV